MNFDASSDIELKIVLFVICVQNYWEYQGVRLNTSQYSAHPQEGEFVIMEGCPMVVLGIDEIQCEGLYEPNNTNFTKS